MKKAFLFTVLTTICFAAFAQMPKMRYQAVLRDAGNRLVTHTAVTVDVTITYGSNTYSETGLTATTDANGLFSVEIGSVSGYEAIHWENATIKTVVRFGSSTIESTSPVTAVPYALNARLASDLSPNGMALPAIYDKIHSDSAALHDVLLDTSAAIRSAIPAAQANADWSANSGVTEILNKPAVNNDTLFFIFPNNRVDTFTANQPGNTEVNITFPAMSVQDFLNVLAQMTPEQLAALRDSLGITLSDPNSCGTMTDFDGHSYRTVKIGTQCWTKTNLRTTHYRNGGAIPVNQTATSLTPSYYSPSASDAVAEHYPDSVYGMYYNGYAVEGDSLCPEGWHLPTKAEWEVLTAYVSSHNSCGDNPGYNAKALAGTHRYVLNTEESVYAWSHNDKNCAVGSDRGTNNATGFSAFPAGNWSGSFQQYGLSTDFWTSTPYNNQTWVFHLSYSEEMVSNYGGDRNNAFSVRCVKDTVPTPHVFSCGTEKIMDADSNLYETVRIGRQCWTKTNLRTTKFRNGNTVAEDVNLMPSLSASFYRFPYYDDIPQYSDSTFGFYYNWYAAADTGDSRLCPEGWHVPDDGDWLTLWNHLATHHYCGTDPTFIAKALADSLVWIPNTYTACTPSDNTTTNNASGFTAVPAGYFESYNTTGELYMGGYAEVSSGFWSTTLSADNEETHFRKLFYGVTTLTNLTGHKWDAMSVRCVKDTDMAPIVEPAVTTDSAVSVSTVSYRLYGSISNPDSIVIINKGFEWKKSTDSHYNTRLVTGTALTSTLENLNKNTQYTYRAFITYDDRTYYGDELTFTTPVLPSATTDSATHISQSSATLHGTVHNSDNVTLTAKGFFWKQSHGVYEYDTAFVTGTDTAMTVMFNDLTPNTKYDYKAFIQYEGKTVYGDLLSFTTPNNPEVSCGTMTDFDGNVYQTVQIGSQCWAKTNLRTTRYRNGSTISTAIGTVVPAYYRLSQWDKDTTIVATAANAADSIFGFYYNGYAAIGDSLCPPGWHVPNYGDWSDLVSYLRTRPEYWCDNDNSNLAKAVASRNFWYNVATPPVTYTINHDAVARPCSPQYQGTDYLNDASYFSAIPAGAWYDNLGGNIDTLTGFGGREFDPGKDAHFWSSTTQENSDSTGFFFRLGIKTYDVVGLAYDALKYGRSVRCVKDPEFVIPPTSSNTTTGAGDDQCENVEIEKQRRAKNSPLLSHFVTRSK